MCDKAKVEVLARELCLAYWNGKASEGAQYTNFTSGAAYVESCWDGWEEEATLLLKVLDKHE